MYIQNHIYGEKKKFISAFYLLIALQNKLTSCVKKCAKRFNFNLDAKTQQRSRLPNVRSLGSTEELFVENVNRDIRRFLRRHTKNWVLLFPPVSSFHRFLIHQTCETVCKDNDLCTFSVGQGYHRRTVICYRNQILDPSKISTAQTASESAPSRYHKPFENWRSSNASGSAHTKPSYDRWNSGLKMGVGINGNDNGGDKLQSSESLQQGISPRNYNLCSEAVEIPSTSQNLVHRQSSTDASGITNSVSCSYSPATAKEFEDPQISVNPKDKSNTATTLSESSKVGEQSSKVQTARRERRPDRAVYVPRARRSQTTPPTTSAAAASGTPTATTTIMTTTATTSSATVGGICTTNTNTAAGGSSIHHQKSNSIMPSNVSGTVGTTSSSKADDITKKKSKNGSCNNSAIGNNISTGQSVNTGSGKERRGERHRKSLEKSKSNSHKELTNKESHNKIISNKQKDCDRKQNSQSRDEEQATVTANNTIFSFKQDQPIPATEPFEVRTAELVVTSHAMKSTKNSSHTRIPLTSATYQNGIGDATLESKMKMIELPVPKVSSHMLIEEVASSGQAGLHGGNPPKCDIDEQELQRASKEINRSNRRIMKQTFVSDVLEIPEKMEHAPDYHAYISNAKALSPSSANFDSNTEDEEDDWESKYDESGECLDPRILEELESAVGKVQITTPKTDYSAFLTNQAILNDEEFPHVLEVSNFPVEFKNQDLLMVFSQYKESGFDIKWVDDTHALAVFSSSRVAAEVLTMGHPFVVLKPLAEATLESRLKAKKCAGSLQPYRQRPETCAALARRLVTGALGVRLETAAAERENEKRVLRKAKERKLLAAKQRDEAWES